MPNTNIKMIYSLRVYIELENRGFKPLTAINNPYKPNLMCWAFEETPELLEAVDEILSSKGGSK
jgi:hypothetical protein